MYRCQNINCKNYKAQPLFCNYCNDKEDPPHDHKVRTISAQLSIIKREWTDMRTNVD